MCEHAKLYVYRTVQTQNSVLRLVSTKSLHNLTIFSTLSVTFCSHSYSLENILLQQEKCVIYLQQNSIVIHISISATQDTWTTNMCLFGQDKKKRNMAFSGFFSCTYFKCLVLITTRHMNTTVLIEIQLLFIQICTSWQTFSDMLIPSVSCQRLSCSSEDEVLCLNAFEIKSQVQNKRLFQFLNVFHCLLLSAWLNRARLHLDLFLRLWWFCFLVADVWSNCHQCTAAIDRVEEVPRFFRDLPRVSSCRASARTHTHVNITNIIHSWKQRVCDACAKSLIHNHGTKI